MSAALIRVVALATLLPACAVPRADHRRPPNIVLILADDLGYGDLGCYGQQVIRTPHLDELAGEGMRFTDFYAGATVCAPSRCVLMTGLHTGHCTVRGNADKARQSLRDEDVTVAEVLQQRGYATGMFGKWGLGEEGTPGLPARQGFDEFFGYLNQAHAHNYYPEYLWRSDRDGLRSVRLANVLRRDGRRYEQIGAGMALQKREYSHDLIVDQALDFIDRHTEQPFFLYLPLTIPHANNEATRLSGNGQEVPDFGPYVDRDWPDPDRGQAAMISRMDADVGRIVARLERYGLSGRTLLLFTSDNGHHDEGGHATERFDPNGPLRGKKRDLYEGGIRVPLIARWPGTIQASRVTDHVASFADILATAADLAHTAAPAGLDGLSFAPTLLGNAEAQSEHEVLYWEFHERGSSQAVRSGRWKAVRAPIGGPTMELYDLQTDLAEQRNLAGQQPAVEAMLELLLDREHVPSERFRVAGSQGTGP